MSGHSKWSTIKHKKGAADAKRGAIFSKMAKNITVAAREGGGDLAMNFKLRVLVDGAKKANMPKDNIDRAIKRGTGEGKDAIIMYEGLYEAYGPSGVAFVVETLADNKNRVVAEVTTAMKKSGATPADAGSVMYNFEKKTVVVVEGILEDQDAFELAMIDAGADDIKVEDGVIVVFGEANDFQKLVEAVEATGLEVSEAGLQYVAKITLEVDQATQEKVDKITEALEDVEDVQAVYTNVA